MPTDYKTVADSNISNFDAEVTRLMAEGFELYGSPYALSSEKGWMVCQAMVRHALSFSEASEVDTSGTEIMLAKLKGSVATSVESGGA